MCINVFKGLKDLKLKYFINIGSDAVYKDSLKELTKIPEQFQIIYMVLCI